jgi:hypothetical protein
MAGMLLLCGSAFAGTFYNPTGSKSIQEQGAQAAETLNAALSSLHLMYAALERGDKVKFEEHRLAAIDTLGQASAKFGKLESQMPDRKINIQPRTDSEKDLLNTFMTYTYPKYMKGSLVTEKQLVAVAVTMASTLKARLERNDIVVGSADWRPVREVIRMQLDLTGAGLATSTIFANSAEKK